MIGLKPHNIKIRTDQIKDRAAKLLQQEIVIGDIDVYPCMLDFDPNDVKTKIIKGSLKINNIKNLTVLPEWITKIKKVEILFSCSMNSLTSLEGCPEWVGGSFFCSGNLLTNLVGGPKWVGFNYWCKFNRLQSHTGLINVIGTIYSDLKSEDDWIKTIQFG